MCEVNAAFWPGEYYAAFSIGLAVAVLNILRLSCGDSFALFFNFSAATVFQSIEREDLFFGDVKSRNMM